MSAQTTIETVTIEEAVVYIDNLGNLYCTYCYHDGLTRPCERSLTVDGECCRCERSGQDSIEVVTGTALIEYPPCKVY